VARKRERTEDPSWAFLAPVDLREHDLPVQAALGFHRGRTEELLNRAADTIERLNREIAELRQAKGRWKQERRELSSQIEEERTRAERLLGEAMLETHKAGQALRAEAEAEAEALRAVAEALLAPARQEAKWLVAEARAQAKGLIADAEAECERLAAQTEQYKLLAADVQRRSVGVLRSALEALDSELVDTQRTAGEEPAPFRKTDRRTAAE
jgi:cell division septum initiation protein DivIVA